MRAIVAIAIACLTRAARSGGLWAATLATVVPMLLLYLLIPVFSAETLGAAATMAASIRGEDPKEAQELFAQMPEEERRETNLDMCIVGSIKVIGAVATLIVILFVATTNEAVRRSAAQVAAHPIRRSSLILGSYAGALLVGFMATLTMTLLAFLLFLASSGKCNWEFFRAALYITAGLAVTTAYAVLLTTTLHAAVGAFIAMVGAYVASVTVYVHVLIDQAATHTVAAIGRAILLVIPRIGDFMDVALHLATRIHGSTQQQLTASDLPTGLALAAVHVTLALALATWAFSRREL